jgi:ferrous iron transport protein A
MSSVSDLMRRRRLPAGVSPVTETWLTLAQLGPGQRATVTGYDDRMAASTARRLFDLGLTPGIEVEMVRRAPLRDPVIFRVGDYEIALRAEQSQGIHVKAVR